MSDLLPEPFDGEEYVVGVDGCPGGWVSIALAGRRWIPRIHRSFDDLVAAYPRARCIAVDIPIGLATGARRGADVCAKAFLKERQQSVFWSPDLRILDAPDMAYANHQLWGLDLPGISIQTWCILPKIKEVNRAMKPEMQDRIVEVHPEVSFAAMAGTPMKNPKGKQPGYDERANLLRDELGIEIPERRNAFKIARPAKPDDVLDAIVAAWSASRVAIGVAKRLPETGETNADGLRMEIVY